MDLSHFLKNCVIYSAEQSSIDLLPPNQPAVYAFYELFRFNGSTMIDDVDRHKTRYGRTIALKPDKLPESFSIQMRGNPIRFKGQGRKLCQDADVPRKTSLCEALMFLSIYNEPLYIGETNDIKVRFRAHHDKDFLYLMKADYKRSPDEFLLFAYYCANEDARVLESILIQLINPPFCDQKS